MAARYTILSVLIRPEIQEKISIGLLFFDNDDVHFAYSKHKLNAAKSLLSAASFNILKDILENIERKIEANNYNVSEHGSLNIRIVKNKILDNAFSASYISYLSSYSNNILSFVQPKEINLEMNSANFMLLFRKYIDNIKESNEPVPKLKPFEYIRNQFGDRITEHYDLNKEVTPEKVPNLIVPVRVDFAGRNKIDVYAQTVDMEATPQTVSRHINAFVQLKTTYGENEIEMKDFIIAKEPEQQKFPKQHEIWKQLRSSSILNYLDLSESEKIIEYAIEHNVIPVSKAEE